jgi:CO/xanthine dehydrogenase FAD-binding subunit
VEFAANPHSAFYKLGLRNAMAISIATAAAALRRDKSGCITDVAIAMGSVAPYPLRCEHAEQVVLGKTLHDLEKPEIISQLTQALNQDISPIDDVRASAEYRREVAPVLVKRVLLRAGCSAPVEGRA